MADQVLADQPSLSNCIFTGSCSDYSYFFPTLRDQHLAEEVLTNLPPLSNGNFIESCCDCSYFFPTLRVQHLAGQVLANLPSLSNINFTDSLPYSDCSYLADLGLWRTATISKGNFTDSCSTLRVHIQLNSVCRWTHSFKWQFHRFLLWLLIFLSYSESSTFGRPIVLADISPLSNGNFTDSCSDCSYFFPTLMSSTFGRPGLGRSTPPLKWQFHRFLLYSESSYLADQVLADLSSLPNGNFTDSCSTLRVHIW